MPKGLPHHNERMTLQIGPIAVDPPVILAPMAGVTNLTFRTLCRTYGAGLYVNEMVSARGVVEQNVRTRHMLQFADDEPVRSVQLFGVDPVVVGEAVRRLIAEVGADHIDINLGCPAGKVTRRGGGAALPLHPRLLQRMFSEAVQAAGPVPITVKMRMGVDDDHLTAVPSGRIAEAEGIAAVALHARTAYQLYSGKARWEAIGELKQAVTTIPVLGNGDIWEATDALEMMESTGCDGVVIGRGCLGRPWLFRDLVDVFAGRAPQGPPLLGVVIETMRQHARMLTEHFSGERGVRNFRKHVAWYLTGYPVGGRVRHRLAQSCTLTDLDEGLATLDPQMQLLPGSLRTPRGHTSGPRRVDLPEGWLEAADDPTAPQEFIDFISGG